MGGHPSSLSLGSVVIVAVFLFMCMLPVTVVGGSWMIRVNPV